MLSLLATAFLAQKSLPDLKLAITEAFPIADQVIARMPPTGRRGLRGLVVSKDGQVIFTSDGAIRYMYRDTDSSASGMGVFFRDWIPGAEAITSNQMAWLKSDSKTFDKAKHIFSADDAFDVLDAKDRDTVIVSHSASKQDADYGSTLITQLSMEYGDPKVNKLLFKPTAGEISLGFLADRSSEGYLAQIATKKGDQWQTLEHRFVGGSFGGKVEIRPGYAPFLFDSAADLVLCYTYSESGFPGGLAILHLKSAAEGSAMGPRGGLGVCSLQPGGRILSSSKEGYVGESDDPQLGLYECSPPYKVANFLGPYRIKGSSRDGKWLVLSHTKLRKSWLVLVKQTP